MVEVRQRMTRDSSKPNSREWSRRKLLAASSGVGASFIAGCASGGGGDPTQTEAFETTSGGGGGTETDTPEANADCEPKDNRFDFIEFSPPQDVNVAVNAGPDDYTTFTLQSAIINEWTGWGNPDPDKAIPLLYDTFELNDDGTEWTISMVEDHSGWHDGTPIHINDFRYNAEFELKYAKLTGTGSAAEGGGRQTTLVEEFNVQDDYTLVAPLSQPRHPGTFFTSVPYPSPAHPAKEMEEWWERMMDATTASEAESIMTEYQNLSLPLNEHPDEHVGNGIFEIAEITDSYVDLTKVEDHKFADQQNIDTMRCHFYGGDAAMRLAWQNGVPDFGYPPSGNINFPDKYRQPRFPQIEGGGLDFNQWNEHLAKRDFRRALFYLFDLKGATRASGNNGFPANHQSGLPTRVARDWIPDWENFRGNLIQYGTDRNTEKATSLLEGMGYSKEGGNWVDSSGDVLSFTIGVANSWPQRWGEHAIRDQMRQFGFEVEYTVFEDGQFGGWGSGRPEFVNPRNGHWDILPGNRGPDNVNFPYIGFISDTNYYQGLQITPHGQEFEDREWNYANRALEVEIPAEVGVESLEEADETMMINIREEQQKMIDPTTSKEEQMETTRKMAWYLNYDMPCNYINWDTNSFTGNFRDFVFPDIDGDGRADNYYSNRLESGIVKGKCK